MKLFDGFCEEEHNLIGDMIFRVGNTELSFYSWSATLSAIEKDFVVNLAHKVDMELYDGIIEEDGWTEFAVFAEIMIYYTAYDTELGILMPSVGLFYAEAVKSVS